jgi:uncharacterized protein (DUF1778 family)
VLADQQQIVLPEDEAARFLDALDTVDQDTVVRLRELRERGASVTRLVRRASVCRPNPKRPRPESRSQV